MTPPNKPEWIHLAETDSAPQKKKSSRALPALVLAAAMSIVGLGALVAQNGAETPAAALEQGTNLSSASSPAEPSTPKQPSIASLPTGGGDDDEAVDHDDDEEDDDH
ncbi:MAG: hypothetical protein NTV18_02040 [Actinobacteria bacterium]|nr:hypothetical protein [Actinomycetota bacterium]